MHHEQDMRKMGGLRSKIPFTFWMMVIGTLALTGFPLTAGYFSKDAIVEASFASNRPGAFYAFLMITSAAGLTSFYSWRLIFMTFFGKAHWEHQEAHHGETHHDDAQAVHDAAHDADAHGHGEHGHSFEPHESPMVMLIPLAVLAFGSIFAGLAFGGFFIGEGQADFWKGALYLGPDNQLLHEIHTIPAFVTFLPFWMMCGGFLVASYVYLIRPGTAARWAEANPLLYKFLLNKWYFDELYDLIFVRPAFWIGRLFWKGGDGAIIDGWGPDGVSARVIDITHRVVKLQTGYIYHYAFAMLIGVAALMTYYLFGGIR
jgi:NADH-quinone oxidoreductase subunit L